MKQRNASLLSKMIEQFKEAHGGALPQRIVVEPLALVALGIKRSAAPVWSGIPVTCQEIEWENTRKPGQGTSLAVLLDSKTSHLVASDLVE